MNDTADRANKGFITVKDLTTHPRRHPPGADSARGGVGGYDFGGSARGWRRVALGVGEPWEKCGISPLS